MRAVLAVLALAAAGIASPAGSAGTFPGRVCAAVAAHAYGDGSYRYAVRVESGNVSCASARAVAKAFIERSANPHGWACFRGHQGQQWAAACSATSGAFRGSVVRAYLLGKV